MSVIRKKSQKIVKTEQEKYSRCTLMNSKGIFIGIEKRYKDKKILFLDPKINPKIEEPNVYLFGETINHHVIVSSGNSGKNMKNKTNHIRKSVTIPIK